MASYPFSVRIEQLGESETIAMAQRSRDLRAKGIDIVNLSLGEPDFNTPEVIKQFAKQAIDDNFSHYPPVQGYADLRQAIADKFKRDNNIVTTADQIVVSTGAKQSIMNAVLCLVNPGDEVIVPAPYWVSYKEMVRYAEGTVVELWAGVEQNFKITPEQLDQAITKRTKLFIFSSPSNPTGGAYSEKELRAMVDVFNRHPHVYVISDEIYEHIRYEGSHFSMGSIPSISDRVITVNGVSKAFAMTGWRIGFLTAAPSIVKACIKIQGQFTSATSSISQRAALAAMQCQPSEIHFMVEAFEKRRALMHAGLERIKGFECNKPEGAFYLFPRVSSLFGKSADGHVITDSGALSMYLLDVAHVATVSGTAFGAPDYLRLSYAASDVEIEKALNRIEAAVNRLWG